MLVAAEELFAYFDELGIEHSTVQHRPLFTVEDGRDLHGSIPGLHCKNLFLKDKKGRVWLVVMPGDKRAHIGKIEKLVGAARCSFGKPELLSEVLGVIPGAVTPFALINDKLRRVTVVCDVDMMKADKVNFHPLRNDASTTIKTADLLKFIAALGYEPLIVDCGG